MPAFDTMPRENSCNEEQILVAIIGTGGIKSKIAKKLKVHRDTVVNYINGSDRVAAAYKAECESVGDLCESKLIAKMRKGDMKAIVFYAETQLKERGYVKRSETTGKGGGPLGLVVADANDVSDEILMKIAMEASPK